MRQKEAVLAVAEWILTPHCRLGDECIKNRRFVSSAGNPVRRPRGTLLLIPCTDAFSFVPYVARYTCQWCTCSEMQFVESCRVAL